MLLPLLLLLLLPPAALGAAVDLQCLDANGDPLDWFAMLKQPDGTQFAYISSKASDSWTQPSDADLTRNGPVFATLQSQIFAGSAASSADVLAAYNDEPPPPPPAGSARRLAAAFSSTYGHMKGVVALTAGQRGFWLIHSVPKFPDLSSAAYAYPPTGVRYGQSFLCITVSSSDMADSIGRQLFASYPDLYSIRVSSAALASWPSWADLSKRTRPPAQLLNSTAHLVTSGGLPVMHLAKSANLREDLYAGLLAGQLDSSIQVETWQHGHQLLNSTCSRRYNVTKVLQVRIGSLPDFPSTSDHSKWCVATTVDRAPNVCIGDMNRAESQFRRGGGIACLALDGAHSLFRAAVLGDQPCGDSGVRRPRLHEEGDVADTDDADAGGDKARELLGLFNWVMVAVFCAVAGTLVSVLLLIWLAVPGVSRGGNSQRYQSL